MVGGGSTVFSSLFLAVVLLTNTCSVISADGETAVQENETTGDDPPSSAIPLTIKEIHKVRRRDDPSGRQQNIRLVVDHHDPISGADTFTLTLQTFGNETISYEAVQLPDPSATEFEFEGNFVDAEAIFVEAERNGSTLAYGFVHVDVEDTGSRVAWVGDPKTPSLRVDPGGRAQVEVPGRPSCVRKASGGPCYYFGRSDSPLDLPPPRCDDLGLIVFCDEVVADVQQPEFPTFLELYNREALRVFISSTNRTEVVVSIPENDTILSPNDYACRESYMHTCEQLVDVPESLDYLYIIAVDLDDEGYANVSSGALFEVFKARVVRLAHDVYEVVLAPSNSPGTYSVSLNANARVSCGGDGAQEDSGCRVYFDRAIYDYNLTLSKGWVPNMVIYPVCEEDPPPSSKIYSITSLSESSTKMRVQIQSPRTIAKAEFILFEDYVATSSQEVEVYLSDSGYIVDVPACEGRCELVILGYGVDGTLVETGQAYVKLEDPDVNVAEVGREAAQAVSSLRVEATLENEAIIEGVGKCKGFSSPCYFFQLAREKVESATYCNNITTLPIYGLNRTSLFHCSDSVTHYKELPGDFSVSMPDNFKVVVSGSFPTNLTEVVVFDPNTPQEELSIGHTVCSEITETTKDCMRYINHPDDESTLRVLVTALDSNGTVLSSAMMTYEYTHPEKRTPIWVIVVAVLGCLALAAGAASVLCRKKKQ